MNDPNRRTRCPTQIRLPALAAAGLLAALTATAQVAPSPPTSTLPSGSAPNNEVIEMSPFVVQTDDDTGWVATSSLAGSRLNTPLRDTGASINVLTSEFLADLGAIDLREAIDYSVNVHETMTREDSNNDNFAQEFFDSGRMNIRGIPATVTRNYFRQPLQTDSYNADRIEENRGPNSILFGIGSAGGVLNTMTKRASLGRDFRRASLMLGSYGSYRGTADINQRVLDGRLAVRLNAVHGNMGSFRHHMFNDTQRVHLATTWQVRPQTRLRADYEIGEIKQVTARGIPPLDGFTTWINAGAPLLQAPQAASTPLAITRFSTTANRLVFLANTGEVLNYRGMNRSAQRQVVLIDPQYRDDAINIAGPGNQRDGNLQNLTVYWEEKLGNRTFVEVSHNFQTNNSDAALNGQGRTENAHIYGDPHLFMPDGRPSPYAGEFFTEGDRFSRIINRGRNHATRGLISHDQDFGKWGNYRLAGMAEYEWRQNRRAVLVEAWEGAPFTSAPEGTANVVFRRQYATAGDGASMFLSGPGETGLIQNVPDPTNPSRTLSSTYVALNQGGQLHPIEKQRTFLLGGQARYLKDRLVLGIGVRKDHLSVRTVEAERHPETNQWSVDIPGLERLYQKFVGTTRTIGAVGHATRNISLFYNRSNNLDVPFTQHRILPDGRPPPAPEARGYDYGIGFSFLGGRLAGRANAFSVDLVNATGGGFGGTFSNPQVFNNRVLDGLLAAGVINQSVHDQRSFTSNQAIRNRKLEGYEFNLTGAVTRNWRVTLNYSYTDGYDSAIAPEIKAWAAEAVPWMMQWSTVPISVEGQMVTVADEVARWQANAAQEWLREGDLILGNRKHKVSMFTRYSFSEGPLRGLFLGGGYRHHSKAPTNFVAGDILAWSNSRWESDALAGYQMQKRLWFLKRGVRVQLNVKNVFNNTDPRITRYSSNGTINRVNIEAPRSYRLTTSFDF
jgi:iron complex outermembrane recepter protein